MQFSRAKINTLFLTMLVLALILIAMFWSQINNAFRWNLANVLLTHARLANNSEEMYRDSLQSSHLLSGFDNTPDVISRLSEADHLIWRSASTLGLSEFGVEIYKRISKISDNSNDANSQTACSTTIPLHLEAGNFANVTADGMARPRKIGGSSGTGAILFTIAPPISHTVCVPKAGIYTIAVAAIEGSPPPIEIEVEWNGWYVGTLAFTQGNNSLSMQELHVAIPPGNHLLSLRYANDFADRRTGVDRNALIDYVEISGP